MLRGTRSLLCGLAAALFLAACGVPAEDEVTTTPEEQVPFGLLDDAAVQTSTTVPPPAGPVAEIYLVDQAAERLVARTRPLEDEGLEDVVGQLGAGPTDEEAEQGMTSALPDSSTIGSVTLSEGIAEVDLGAAFADLDGATQRWALAQIVFTLTARPGIGRVAFTLESQPVDVPLGDGTLTRAAVSRDGYRELAPAS